jgi:hypothetical protein
MNREQRRKNAKNVKNELKSAGSKELFDTLGLVLNHNESSPVDTRVIVDIIRRDVYPNITYKAILRALKYVASIGLVTELPQAGKASVWVRA